MQDEDMADTRLLLWDFEEAPVHLRCLLPFTSCMNAWVAFVCEGSSLEVVEVLIARWKIAGQTILRFDVENVGLVIGGFPERGNEIER
jgi:hypothetical protein